MTDFALMGTVYASDDVHHEISIKTPAHERYLIQPNWWDGDLMMEWVRDSRFIFAYGLLAYGLPLVMKAILLGAPRDVVYDRSAPTESLGHLFREVMDCNAPFTLSFTPYRGEWCAEFNLKNGASSTQEYVDLAIRRALEIYKKQASAS